MCYDPFQRGPHPVGVRSDQWTDPDRDRALPVEIWYPGTDRIAGADLDPATQDRFVPAWVVGDPAEAELAYQAAVRDAHPLGEPSTLVLLVHGWAGYRREATFIGTHLASHGYTVVAPDVAGSTYADVDAMLTANEPHADPAALSSHVQAIAASRKGDVPFLISAAIERLDVRTDAVGIAGASFGGFSSLIAPAVDPRIAATVPMCPAGGSHAPVCDSDGAPFVDQLEWAWHTPAPTLMLVADRDALLPLHSQLELLRKVPSAWKRMVVLADADHNHFVDDIDTGQEWLQEFSARVARVFPDGPGDWALVARSVVPADQLCDGSDAQLAWRGLTTAHMDAHLRHDPDALALVSGDIDERLAVLGVTVTTIEGHAQIDHAAEGLSTATATA
jgi:dienelactone hydrolase